ncbi:hypothetical protein BSL78_06571 [Apostichopus japonicus]|uniref:Integrase catalytic domain-containing protein n=1 Tax=Stichopus japonicus TaxID=307972 RepID=A0A2G8L8B8_STIJA|nr:hypothetical protein BSL78_06571 [Apostichopus japonicus]
MLEAALYIPSYPQDMFSVKAATNNGATVTFKQGCNILTHKDGTTFNIKEQGRLYYLNVVDEEIVGDRVNAVYDVHTWHEILGHCNFEDILKLQDVVKGKFVNSRSRKLDAKATTPLELVHTDLAGPINPVAKDGFKYAATFTDDYSGAIFVYFIRNKGDTALVLEKFLADCAPYGKVKCIRSDNGSEFTGMLLSQY